MKYIYGLKELPEDKYGFAGGKASSLSRMMRNLKVLIPEGYVILSEAFGGSILKEDAAGELKELIAGLSGDVTYAVRSSALNEDGEGASFAGQYETLTDVKKEDIEKAVMSVASSADSSRVRGYSENKGEVNRGIAVVIQRFVSAEFAGVLFTSDPITGRDDKMNGNYVRGEGEVLVSGQKNAEVFYIDAFDHSYSGNPEFKSYAGKLGRYCEAIRSLYKMPMDIEWAVAEGKVHILQARPVTTLKRFDPDTYRINGTMSGYKLLTRTNVGEIFLKPVSPATFSVLEKINDFLGLPDWLDNICGQPYMNISVMCSLQRSFGRSEKASFEAIKELVGNVPEGFSVPTSPFDRKAFVRNLMKLLFPKERSKLTKKEKHEMVRDLDIISRGFIEDIRKIEDNNALSAYWDNVLLPKLKDGLSSILGESGTSLVPLFSMRNKIERIAGKEMANRLLQGSVGIIDCMKPLLLIEDVIEGRMTKEEYVNTCGHRSSNEMELMEKRPYEDPNFPDDLIEDHKRNGGDLYAMIRAQNESFEEALREFKRDHPGKSKWIDKNLESFSRANRFREDIRSKGVWIFTVFREYLLKAGELNGIGEDVFMLYVDEIFDLIKGNRDSLTKIEARKETFSRYRSYPTFPTLVAGRFDPDKWLADKGRRNDIYTDEKKSVTVGSENTVKGFPGAAGRVTGKVKVITDIDGIDSLEKGDILVTVATNIGWTLAFHKVSAIITDVGAPLSHAAIVAREFGIPAVVGCGNATTVLKTGDVVTVDGSEGTVIQNTFSQIPL